MKKIFLLMFLLITHISIVHSSDTAELRKLYYEAAGERNAADKFLQVMEKMPVQNDPLLLCYRGMANLIKANYSLNPYNKLLYFTKGREMLEQAVRSDPQNEEIRFMRFCVQTNAPFFLGYSREINNDKAFILDRWSKIVDQDLKSKIRNYMIESSACNQEEKLLLQ